VQSERRDGAFRAVCFVASLAKGPTIRFGSLRASHPEKLPVATANTCAEAP